jgi:pimeloyl-ACP methyl ester carboxylesterase
VFLRVAVLAAVIASLATGGAADPSAATNVAPSSPPFSSESPGGYLRGPERQRVIVFVNGIFGDAVSTWKNDDGAYWPTMIAADPAFDEADIYVHSFQSPKLARAQQIIDLASRLRALLTVDRVFGHKQIVFLAHSMGGLVTRAMIVKERPPASKIPMIYFFATPSAGADVAAIASHLSENPQLKDMLPLTDGGYVKLLREQWLETSDDARLNYPNAIASYCAYENQKKWGVLIVPEVSATYLCNRETHAVNADHIGIVKPKNARDDPYVYFKAAYERTFGETARVIASAIATRSIKAEFTFDRGIPITTPDGAVSTFFLRQTKGTSNHIDVGCEETRRGELHTKIALKPTERVIDVTPIVANSINVKSSWAAVVRNTNGEAVIHYSLQGLDREHFNCPGGGHADVVVNFVVEPQADASP